jgi:phenylalanyl-tRNA synthetase beta chain
MPTIDIDYAEFEKLLGLELHRNTEKIGEVLEFVKGEVRLFDEKSDVLSVEIKDTGRPDVWNVEGLARALRGFLGLESDLREYKVGKPIVDVHVDLRLGRIRPYIGCSIVKDLKLSDTIIRGFMHMQDKLDQSYGRERQRTSIGLYDFDLIKPPLSYSVAKPTEISFAPLGFAEKMSLKEILQKHPKGLEYGHIVDRHSVYPVLLDAEGNVLSFPPVINSNDLGRITDQTRNVLVEVTGTMSEAVLDALKIATLSLIDRGGKAYSANVHYSGKRKPLVTPCFDPSSMDLDAGYVNRVTGLSLTMEQIVELLPRGGYGAEKLESGKVRVQVPCYRVDVMHPVDLAEDVAIAYGYNNIRPLWRKLPTIGRSETKWRLLDVARELMVGLGFQEVLTFTLTNPEDLFERMNVKKQRIVELANPKVQTMTCLRNWLLPNLMGFLSSNLSVEYPQRIFELGKVTVLDERRETRTRDEDWLAAVASHASASFTEIKSDLDAFLTNFGLDWQIRETKHPSFIDGRAGTALVGKTEVGILGEISPRVVTAWKLENPVAAFELNLERVVRTAQARHRT